MLALAACGGEGGTGMMMPPPVDASPPPPPPPLDAMPMLECPAGPTAYLFDHADPVTRVQGAEALLRGAGFNVEPLPLDRSPAELTGVVFLASFASESPQYARYMNTYGADLSTFVARGNLLVQMTQADQTEAAPPFLPATLKARRHDLDLGRLYALNPYHPLLRGTKIYVESGSWATERYLMWEAPTLGWETFTEQSGFEIVLADNSNAKNAVMLEGVWGAGRFVLVAASFDKPTNPGPGRDAFVPTFFANLARHAGNVCRGTAPALRVMPQRGTDPFSPGSWVLAVLPDTQYYTLEDRPTWRPLFTMQTNWIVQNARRLRIPYVLQLGDLVSHNLAKEWEYAATAMAVLDNRVPYAIVPGNHDMGPNGSAHTRDTLMNDHFSYERTSKWPTFGGAYEPGRLDNTYHLFSAGGRDFIVIALEWGPRDQVIAWADGVMKMHPNRWGIFITHAYVNWNDRRYNIRDTMNPQDFNPHHYGTPGGVNDGEELWDKLISKHRFAMVLSGHVLADGTGYLTSQTWLGNRCHQILSNYQIRDMGGQAYMRLMEFLPDDRTVRVWSYSPFHDAYLWDYDQYFSFTLD